jgi:arylsulfatase A-like enzyme
VPFYLYMAHYAIHAPWEKDDRFYGPYEEAGLPEFEATYASMIESQDHSFGDFLACLERLGIEENTVVVFMTDNGQPKQVPRNRPLRGHKITPYEGGIRVPLIVRWPGVTTAGSTCDDRYVIVEDIFPTFLAIAGVHEDDPKEEKIDGVSFVPLLTGSADYPQERPIYWHYPNTYDQTPYSSVRMGDWKLIYHHASRTLELYNIKTDISERRDLADSEPERKAQLASVLADHLRDAGAKMTIDKATGKPVPLPDQL